MLKLSNVQNELADLARHSNLNTRAPELGQVQVLQAQVQVRILHDMYVYLYLYLKYFT